MYYILKREYYCPQMASDVFSTARNFWDCIRLWGTHFKHQTLMKLFRATASLGFVAMNLLASFKKTARGSTFILVTTDQSTKPTRSITLRDTTPGTGTASLLEY